MKNKTKFTPGPWEVIGSGIYIVSDDVDREKIATTVPHGAFNMNVKQEANALLIAAAPEMIVELQKALVVIEYLEQQHGEYGGHVGAQTDPIMAIIKKALGE